MKTHCSVIFKAKKAKKANENTAFCEFQSQQIKKANENLAFCENPVARQWNPTSQPNLPCIGGAKWKQMGKRQSGLSINEKPYIFTYHKDPF